jgi:hypothetical protein
MGGERERLMRPAIHVFRTSMSRVVTRGHMGPSIVSHSEEGRGHVAEIGHRC